MASTVDRCREALTTTDEPRLTALAADRSEWVRSCVPLNPAARRGLLHACLSDRSWRVLAAVTARTASDEAFWRDPARRVRLALAASVFVLPQIRAVLAADPDPDVPELMALFSQGDAGDVGVDGLDAWLDDDRVTEDDLLAGAARPPGAGAAAALQSAAAAAYDRTADAVRQQIRSVQRGLPLPAREGPVVDRAELHVVAIRTDVASRPAWLAGAVGAATGPPFRASPVP